jgi:hypothetical protein
MDSFNNYVVPQAVSGYKLRVGNLGNLHRLIYSKDGSFLMPNIFNEADIKTDEFKDYFKRFASEVLYESEGPPSVCSIQMKEKLFLNNQVEKEFENVVMGYDTTTVFNVSKNTYRIAKLFEIYSIIDFKSNAVYFVCISTNPIRDAQLILNYINGLKNKYQKYGVDIKFESPECDSPELLISNKLHLLSFSADDCIHSVRKIFQKEKWKINLMNKDYFAKKEAEYLKINDSIILCEGKDKKIFNQLNLNNIIFSDEHNSVSIYQNVKTLKIKCLRDRDFLTSDEISKLKRKFPKYFILDYYSLENYLYHPDNILEALNGNFNVEEYKNSIINDKNKKLGKISSSLVDIRKTYLELNENHIKPTANAEHIILSDLSSNEFHRFYKYFKMKDFDKSYLNKYSLSKNKLGKTQWFKIGISALIEC